MPLPIADSIAILDISLDSDAAIGDHIDQVTFSGH
jgi:hypothetical protein